MEEDRGRSECKDNRKGNGGSWTVEEPLAAGEEGTRNGRQNAKQRQRPVHSVEGKEREPRHERLRHPFFPADAEVERFQVLRKKPVEFE